MVIKNKNTFGVEKTAFDNALNKILRRVEERVGKRCLVEFSAYKSDSNDEPIDNLDEIPFPGKIKLRALADEFYGGSKGKDYESSVLENQTWLDLCYYANKMILTTNDHHHVFLEGIEAVGKDGDVTIFEFIMGS